MRALAFCLILSFLTAGHTAFAQEFAFGGGTDTESINWAGPSKGGSGDFWSNSSAFMYGLSSKNPKCAGDEPADQQAKEAAQFTARAKQRLSALECGSADVQATRNDPEKSQIFGNDIAKKLILLLEYQKAADKEYTMMVNNAQPLPSMAPTAEHEKHRRAYLNIARREEETLNSIPYIQTRAVRDFVRGQIQMYQSNARAEPTLDELTKSVNSPSGVASVLKKAQEQLEGEQKNLNKGIDSGWKDSDHLTKESLVQNGPSITGLEDKDLGCRMNAKYGDGAKARDKGILAVQVGLVAASMGTGLLADMADAAVVARTAATSGQISWRTANIAMISGQTAIAVPQIRATCSKHNLIGGDEQNSCQGISLQRLRKDNCGLAVTLNVGAFAVAGGVEALSIAGKSIVASMLPEGLPIARGVARAASLTKKVANPLTPDSASSLFDSHLSVTTVPEPPNNSAQLTRAKDLVGDDPELSAEIDGAQDAATVKRMRVSN